MGGTFAARVDYSNVRTTVPALMRRQILVLVLGLLSLACTGAPQANFLLLPTGDQDYGDLATP